jgi:hypothetical protein
LFVTSILPPCASIIYLQLTRPKPVPLCLIVNKGSNIFEIIFSGILGPEFSKEINNIINLFINNIKKLDVAFKDELTKLIYL